MEVFYALYTDFSIHKGTLLLHTIEKHEINMHTIFFIFLKYVHSNFKKVCGIIKEIQQVFIKIKKDFYTHFYPFSTRQIKEKYCIVSFSS
jgi:hypothetical protein